ncbi:MAG: hypothetical protein J6Y37_12040 [Paludibacteraceae bacterium]|nr:hypothetical protein [Paludibacteraceae bacterium]
MIESGVKKEEYRGITPYWCNRLLYGCTLGVKEYWDDVLARTKQQIEKHGERMPNAFNLKHLLVWEYGTRAYTHVRFRRGYTNHSMLFRLDKITIGKGNAEWGAPDVDVFVLKLGDRVA